MATEAETTLAEITAALRAAGARGYVKGVTIRGRHIEHATVEDLLDAQRQAAAAVASEQAASTGGLRSYAGFKGPS